MTSCLTSAAGNNRGVVGKMKGEKNNLSLHFTVKLYFIYIMVVVRRLDTNNKK